MSNSFCQNDCRVNRNLLVSVGKVETSHVQLLESESEVGDVCFPVLKWKYEFKDRT